MWRGAPGVCAIFTCLRASRLLVTYFRSALNWTFCCTSFFTTATKCKILRHFYCNLCTLAEGKRVENAREMGGKTEENESEIPVLPGTALFGHCLLTHPMGVINVCGALFTAARTPAVFSLPNESIFYGRPRIRRIRWQATARSPEKLQSPPICSWFKFGVVNF